MVIDTKMGRRSANGKVIWDRHLPKCKKTVPVQDIRNRQARFSNRKRPRGWLTPTANQLLQTHQNAIDKVLKILPVTDIVVELNKFSFARMENPKIRGKEYCYGPLYGFSSVEDVVDKEQGCKCLFCKRKIDVYHHIRPKSRGGSDALPNRAGLCYKHHDDVHKDADMRKKLLKKKQGLSKKYGALSTLNQIISFYWEYLQKFEPFVHVHATNGWDTKDLRDAMGLTKDHPADAWCIAASILDRDTLQTPIFDLVYHIMQFRRHNRAKNLRTETRKYYLDGNLVATNRHKTIVAVPKKKRADDGTVEYTYKAQPGDSLEEFRSKMAEQYGEKEAERIVGKLTVAKSKRCYNDLSRTMPGAVFLVNGTRHVMQGQHNNCSRYEQAFAGLSALKFERTSLKKKLTAAKKAGDVGSISDLETKIASVEERIPKVPEYQKTVCRLELHNSGLVYVTDHIA
ncbi:MAG: HNH endonuclease [Clostridiales bacterium]|nr:HNH endonuclease [Clostridiales bacterium]